MSRIVKDATIGLIETLVADTIENEFGPDPEQMTGADLAWAQLKAQATNSNDSVGNAASTEGDPCRLIQLASGMA